MGPKLPESHIFPATMLGSGVQLLYGCHPEILTITSSPVSGWLQVPLPLLHVLKIPRSLLEDHGMAPNYKTSGYHHVISFLIYSLFLLPVSHHRAILEIPLEIQKTPFISEHQLVLPEQRWLPLQKGASGWTIHCGSFRSSMQGNLFIRGHCHWGYC